MGLLYWGVHADTRRRDNGPTWLDSLGRRIGVHKEADVLTGAQVKASSARELDLHVAIWEGPHVGDRFEAQVAPDVDFPTAAL